MGKVKKKDASPGTVYRGINKGLGLWGSQDPLVLSRSLKSQTLHFMVTPLCLSTTGSLC